MYIAVLQYVKFGKKTMYWYIEQTLRRLSYCFRRIELSKLIEPLPLNMKHYV